MLMDAPQTPPKSVAQKLVGGTRSFHVQVLNLLSGTQIECLIN